jgi:hypothetical protein
VKRSIGELTVALYPFKWHNTYKILDNNPKGKRTLAGPIHKGECNAVS